MPVQKGPAARGAFNEGPGGTSLAEFLEIAAQVLPPSSVSLWVLKPWSDTGTSASQLPRLLSGIRVFLFGFLESYYVTIKSKNVLVSPGSLSSLGEVL